MISKVVAMPLMVTSVTVPRLPPVAFGALFAAASNDHGASIAMAGFFVLVGGVIILVGAIRSIATSLRELAKSPKQLGVTSRRSLIAHCGFDIPVPKPIH